MALCMEAFTDTLPIVCNGFKQDTELYIASLYQGAINRTIGVLHLLEAVYSPGSWERLQEWYQPNIDMITTNTAQITF